MKLNTYIVTSNKYIPLLKPFSYLFNKFWDETQQVTFLGNDIYPDFELPKNFSFHSLGNQNGIQHWSTDLRKFIQDIPDQYFILSLEDLFPVQNINLELFNYLVENYLTPDIGRISLGSQLYDKSHTIIDNYKDCNILLGSPNIRYRLCTQWSIWNKDFLLEYLKPNMSPWDFELQGYNKPLGDNYKVIGCSTNPVIIYCDAARARGKVNGADFSDLNFNGIMWERNRKYEKSGLIDQEILQHVNTLI